MPPAPRQQARLSKNGKRVLCGRSRCRGVLADIVGVWGFFNRAVEGNARISFSKEWRQRADDGCWALTPYAAAARRRRSRGEPSRFRDTDPPPRRRVPDNLTPREFVEWLERETPARPRRPVLADGTSRERSYPELPCCAACPECEWISEITDEVVQSAVEMRRRSEESPRSTNLFLGMPGTHDD